VDLQTVDILSRFAGAAAAVIASCTVAGLTAYFAARQARIAQRQANIAQDKLALDLFQRRIDVYSTVRRVLRKSHGLAHRATARRLRCSKASMPRVFFLGRMFADIWTTYISI
jgi:hypothetical protein